MDYIESLNLAIVEPVNDLTIVPHKEVGITLNGERFQLQRGDRINVTVKRRSESASIH